jgi:uncharacterized protein YbaR (Trm112 family)
MPSPSYTINIIMNAPEFAYCPQCGAEVFSAPLMTVNGPETEVVVCPKCKIAWPVQED